MLDRSLLRGLVGFEAFLYAAVAILLAAAAVFVLVGTVHELAHAVSISAGAVDTGVALLDRILLLLIIAKLAYTLRFVLRTHRIAVEPFLFIGLIAVVRRILIVTAQFERLPSGGRILTNFLLELGLLAPRPRTCHRRQTHPAARITRGLNCPPRQTSEDGTLA